MAVGIGHERVVEHRDMTPAGTSTNTNTNTTTSPWARRTREQWTAASTRSLDIRPGMGRCLLPSIPLPYTGRSPAFTTPTTSLPGQPNSIHPIHLSLPRQIQAVLVNLNRYPFFPLQHASFSQSPRYFSVLAVRSGWVHAAGCTISALTTVNVNQQQAAPMWRRSR